MASRRYVYLSDELHSRVKMIAAYLKLTMEEVTDQAFQAYLLPLEEQQKADVLEEARAEEVRKEEERIKAEAKKNEMESLQKRVFGDSLERQKALNAARLKEHGGVK